MVTFIPARNEWADIFGKIGKGASEGYMQRSDENAVRKAIMDLGPNPSAKEMLSALTNTKTYNPQAKRQALSDFLGVEKFEELRRHAQAKEKMETEKNRIAALGKQAQGDQEVRKQNYLDAGYPEYLANIMVDPASTPGVKNHIADEHKELIGRGIRKPLIQQEQQQPASSANAAAAATPANESAPIAENPIQAQETTAAAAAAEPIAQAPETAVEAPPLTPPPSEKKEEWPEIPAPPETTAKEREDWRTKNQTFNNKLLKEVKAKSDAHRNTMIRYDRLTSLNNSNKLPEGMGRLVINPGTGDLYGIAALKGDTSKETQDFVKTLADFLIDAKSYFGGRVTNFDVQAFKTRLPSLLNTSDGRRLIIEQMRLMEQLQTVHDTELGRALKHYGRNASYSDILNVVEDKTKDKEEAVISKIQNLDQASNYLDQMHKDPKFKDHLLMQSPQGKFKAVPNNKVDGAEKKGYTRW
jgi:hypothetical protein